MLKSLITLTVTIVLVLNVVDRISYLSDDLEYDFNAYMSEWVNNFYHNSMLIIL